MLEEAADDRLDANVRRHAGNPGAKAAHSANDQVDLHPGLARLV